MFLAKSYNIQLSDWIPIACNFSPPTPQYTNVKGVVTTRTIPAEGKAELLEKHYVGFMILYHSLEGCQELWMGKGQPPSSPCSTKIPSFIFWYNKEPYQPQFWIAH